jgi:hypothetical protein
VPSGGVGMLNGRTRSARGNEVAAGGFQIFRAPRVTALFPTRLFPVPDGARARVG